jgi:hypothetical protein
MNDYSKITALYSRLSVGDEDRDGGESNSIQNQDGICQGYFHHSRQVLFRMTSLFIENNRIGKFINGDKVIGKITLNELIPYKFSEDSTYRALSSENFAKGKV